MLKHFSLSNNHYKNTTVSHFVCITNIFNYHYSKKGLTKSAYLNTVILFIFARLDDQIFTFKSK